MKKIAIAVAVTLAAGVVLAQPAPSPTREVNQQKAATVEAVTSANAPASQGTQNQAANVAKSKQEPQVLQGKQAKQGAADAITKANAPASQGTRDQAANVAKSKAEGAAFPAAKSVTKAGEQALQKASTP